MVQKSHRAFIHTEKRSNIKGDIIKITKKEKIFIQELCEHIPLELGRKAGGLPNALGLFSSVIFNFLPFLLDRYL